MEPEEPKTHDQLAADARSAADTPAEPIMKFFAWSHLPPRLQPVSEPFHTLACSLLDLPRSAERTVALRKLLESKDAAVRAALEGKSP